MPIHVLSAQLASQIAAGEVVERPSSVVKELVENALDAGATAITIEARGGGRQLVQVGDDGCGIPAAEIETAFLRHATSKLNHVDDLKAIRTLGFRGEALAAIAAVSQVTVVSRAIGEATGTRLRLEGGQVVARAAMGAPQGTVIAVEQLFYNVPARLKFLKSVSTEKRLIDEFVSRYALAYPQVRFRLMHDGRIAWQTNGSGSVLDVLAVVYGPEVARQLLPLAEATASGGTAARDDFLSPVSLPPSPHAERKTISVRGYVGPPSLHWANRSQVTLFVNGRWVKDSSLTYAVIQAYHTLLPTGRYPFGLIFIHLPPEEVDVNVHPAKTEVRFQDANAVFTAVQRAVRETLVADSPIRSLGGWSTADDEPGDAGPGWVGELDEQAFARRQAQAELDLDWVAHETETDTAVIASQPLALPSLNLGGERLPIMRVVGQVGAAYIITEGPDGLFLIDQHAAHERILYEQFMAQWAQNQVAVQTLMAATAVYLTPAQATLLEEYLPTLANIGFQVEPFGPRAFTVRAMPAILTCQDPAQVLLTVVEDLERGDAPLQSKIEERIILRVCKSAAIKAGQTLSPREMEVLVQQLEACRSPHTCPHGRPTLIHLSVAQLARQFGRL